MWEQRRHTQKREQQKNKGFKESLWYFEGGLIFEDEFIEVEEILDRSAFDSVDEKVGGNVGKHDQCYGADCCVEGGDFCCPGEYEDDGDDKCDHSSQEAQNERDRSTHFCRVTVTSIPSLVRESREENG